MSRLGVFVLKIWLTINQLLISTALSQGPNPLALTRAEGQSQTALAVEVLVTPQA